MLVEKEAESIEEMVRRLERKLNEEFRHFSSTVEAAAIATASNTPVSAFVPEQRVPEAVTELEDLEIENKQFADSFVNLKVPSVPSDPTTNTSEWDGLDKMREQPWQRQHEAKNGRMAGAAEP